MPTAPCITSPTGQCYSSWYCYYNGQYVNSVQISQGHSTADAALACNTNNPASCHGACSALATSLVQSKIPPLSTLVQSLPPWGIYSAESFVGSSLYEYRNNGRDAVVSAGVSAGNASGNGASAAISYLSGSTTSTVTWPPGSIPTSFTICSITRYTDTTTNHRILTSVSGNWLQGHWDGKWGEAYYETFLTQPSQPVTSSVGTLTDWLVMCGKNPSTSFPGNILADGTPQGITTNPALASAYTLLLGPNSIYPTEVSNWALSAVIIWDQVLTDYQLFQASQALTYYLRFGGSFSSILS